MVAHSCRRAAVSKSPGLFTSSEKTVARPGAGASSASGITLKSNFDLMPGIYSIRLVVRDTEGQMMTARNGAVRIP